MSRDSLDDLARRLWESAASERPSQELRARIGARRRLAERPRAEPQRGEPRARTSATWFWLAAALGVLAFALLVRPSARDDAPTIGAEDSAHNVRSARSRGTVADARPTSPATALPRAGSSVSAAVPRLTRPTPASSGRSSAVVTERPLPNLAEELQLLQGARALIRKGNYAEALQALDAHAKNARGSNLTSEASLLRMEALAGSGRSAEASSLARRFVEQNPNSPLADRARSFYERENSSP